jgi:hypothetical protein
VSPSCAWLDKEDDKDVQCFMRKWCVHLCGWGSPKEEGGERKDEEVNRKSVCVLAHHLLRASVWLCVFEVCVCVYIAVANLHSYVVSKVCRHRKKRRAKQRGIPVLSLCVVTT